MLDAALVAQCADPSIKPAVVQEFVAQAGSFDPLTVTVRAGSRIVLVPRPQSIEEALAIIRRYAGSAVVRTGLTQFPAGLKAQETPGITADLVDPCKNLRLGTRLFSRVLGVVARWYGNPHGKEADQQIFDDAIYAWKTGDFEGMNIFEVASRDVIRPAALPPRDAGNPLEPPSGANEEAADAAEAGARIDLGQIGVE